MNNNKISERLFNFKCPKCGKPLKCYICDKEVTTEKAAEAMLYLGTANYCGNCGEKIASTLEEALTESMQNNY